LLNDKKKTLRTKDIFDIKRNSNNNKIKYKVWLVAKWFSQIRGLVYELTLSTTLSIDNIKLLIVLAAKFHWNINQLDVKVNTTHVIIIFNLKVR